MPKKQPAAKKRPPSAETVAADQRTAQAYGGPVETPWFGSHGVPGQRPQRPR